MLKKALITGITGQDGSYLTEFLLKKGYEVHGIVRRNSTVARNRLDFISTDIKTNKLYLHYGDLSDASSLFKLVNFIKPDEVYNLGAQSHVRISFDIPAYTADVDGLGALRLLDAIRDSGSHAKYYQASSSEMYGQVKESPQNENTPFHPRSPYACAKVFAHFQTINYRESYGLFACNGILFNHESPRRGENFVTRKICKGVAAIKNSLAEKIALGNLEARRDWGYAPEYVEAMWLMLQQDKPDDYVIATGETHSVQEFLKAAFDYVNLDWKKFVSPDPAQLRPSEVDLLIGDYSKAKKILGWEPKVKFKDLIKIMMDAELVSLGK